jgi:hypothetical protein
MGVRTRQLRTAAVLAPCARRNKGAANDAAKRRALLRRADANGHQRRIRGTRYRAAGRAPFAEELRLITRRPAIGGDQDFVVLALHRASRNTVRTDHPDARAGRTRWTFFALWTRGSRRPGRAPPHLHRLWVPEVRADPDRLAGLYHRRSSEQRHCQRQMRHAHRCILPRKTAAISRLEDQTRQLGARTD